MSVASPARLVERNRDNRIVEKTRKDRPKNTKNQKLGPRHETKEKHQLYEHGKYNMKLVIFVFAGSSSVVPQLCNAVAFLF